MLFNALLSVETTLILSIAALYIIHCPFSKVEESFNTQAVHDIVNIFPKNLPSSNISARAESSHKEIAVRAQLQWDHTQYPGVVPRTFIGALLVGFPMKLAKHLMLGDLLGPMPDSNKDEVDLSTQFIMQIGSRFALACYVGLSISAITRALQKRYGLSFRICYLFITVSQFHFMFYAGRFIPNTFAGILANLVFASWINRQYSKSIIYMAVCAVIFRFDTSLFFALLLFDAVFVRRFLSLGRVLKIGIPVGLICVIITTAIDSFFWARLVWPEFEGFYFNAWLNKSSEWGTQPFFWYIYSCIPRMMMASGPLILLADHKVTREYLIPVLAFVITLSFLPHKELRFILFINPLLNICATSGLMNVYHCLNGITAYFAFRLRRLIVVFIFFSLVIAILSINALGCITISRVSSHNYPGGHAAISLGTTKELLDAAHKSLNSQSDIQDPRSDVAVYLDNLAAQTGATRFIQVDGAYYAKTPELDAETFIKPYNLIYLIFEPPEVVKFLKDRCPFSDNGNSLLEGLNQWRNNDNEIKCTIPNQTQMYCSIVDTINSLKSANLGYLLARLTKIKSSLEAVEFLNDTGFIKTQTALHILRCSTKSKFNPF